MKLKEKIELLLTPKHKIWKTRDGRKIPIHKMEDKHLFNTIAYLERRASIQRAILNLDESVKDTDFFPQLYDLRKEASLRKDWLLDDYF